MAETLSQAAVREFGFNANQLRGPDGKWIKAGSVVKSATHGVGTVKSVDKAARKATVRFGGDGEDGVTKTVSASTLKAAPSADMSPEAKKKRAKRLDNPDNF